jgi:hypothetical protein
VTRFECSGKGWDDVPYLLVGDTLLLNVVSAGRFWSGDDRDSVGLKSEYSKPSDYLIMTFALRRTTARVIP